MEGSSIPVTLCLSCRNYAISAIWKSVRLNKKCGMMSDRAGSIKTRQRYSHQGLQKCFLTFKPTLGKWITWQKNPLGGMSFANFVKLKRMKYLKKGTSYSCLNIHCGSFPLKTLPIPSGLTKKNTI